MTELTVRSWTGNRISFVLKTDLWRGGVVLNLDSLFELYAAIGKMADAEADLWFLTLCDIENVSGDEDFLELVGHGEFAILRITTQSYGSKRELSLPVSLPALVGYIQAAILELGEES